jgi:hypothetical protein
MTQINSFATFHSLCSDSLTVILSGTPGKPRRHCVPQYSPSRAALLSKGSAEPIGSRACINRSLGDGDDALHGVCLRILSHSSGRADLAVWANSDVDMMSYRGDAQQRCETVEERTPKHRKTLCGSRAHRVGQGPSVRRRCGSCAGLAPSIRGRRERPRPRDRAVMFIPALRYTPVFLLDALCMI